MAKADAWTAYIIECSYCATNLVVRDDVRSGDKVKCGQCGRKTTVGAILAACREGTGKKTYDTEYLLEM